MIRPKRGRVRLEGVIRRWLRYAPRIKRIAPRGPGAAGERARVDHVVILDGTNSRLTPGLETNAGITYKLLRETAPSTQLSLHYEAGVAWDSWRATPQVISGKGINARIRRAYGAIASRYRPGDRIFLFGFSRGAYAVRSLAGIIDQIGLLQSAHATERNIRQVFRHYECTPSAETVAAFAEAHCHKDVEIEMVGVWDTVKSLGLRLPVVWRLTEARHLFHNHALGPHVRHGYHALALHEKRQAFKPILWEDPEGHPGKVEQMWFRGVHGDIGGQLNGFNAARPLSNIPLVWMLGKAEALGLTFPDGWDRRFEIDARAPSAGGWRGWNKIFWARKRRKVGQFQSEAVHPSAKKLLSKGAARAPVGTQTEDLNPSS